MRISSSALSRCKDLCSTPRYSIPQWYLLAAILLLAAIVRLYRITEVPAGFFCDEASFAYNAYLLLTSGRDEFHRWFPIFFESFGDYKHPLQFYFTIVPVAFFGLTEFAARLTSALLGIASIFFISLIAREIRGARAGLLAAFVASLTPWLFHYNRVAFEGNSYLLLFCVMTHYGLRAQKRGSLIPFAIAAGFAIYTYQAAKLIVPLWLIFLSALALAYRERHHLKIYRSIAIFVTLSLPCLWSLYAGYGFARLNMIVEGIEPRSLPSLLTSWLANYSLQFNPSLLFFTGEPTFLSRHFTNNHAPLLLAMAPLLLCGLFFTIKKLPERSSLMLCAWFLLYPLGSTFTGEPYTLRSFIGAPVFILFAAFGIDLIAQGVERRSPLISRYLTSLFCLSLAINFTLYLRFYLNEYRTESTGFYGWQYGAKQIMARFLTLKDSYDEMYMAHEFNAPDILIKFYDHKNSCQDKCRIANIAIVQDEDVVLNTSKRQLFAVNPEQLYQSELQYRFRLIEKIIAPGGREAFYLGEVASQQINDPDLH